MKKCQLNLVVKSNISVSDSVFMLELTSDNALPYAAPGQFVELYVDDSRETFLRRPVSIHDFDSSSNTVTLLIKKVGAGTRKLSELKQCDVVNTLLPLGRGFGFDRIGMHRPLLVGGGVGIAPLYYLGKEISKRGIAPTFLFGGKTKADLLRMDEFSRCGEVFATTEDGSFGQNGFATNHSILHSEQFDMIFSCGPTPMMKSVGAYAKQNRIPCEVSLEHKMACGIGACLCCVEKTAEGNVCVCKDGPVFNIDELLWWN